MPDTIPASVALRFHADGARPVIVREYHASTGWRDAPSRRPLTRRVVDELMREGITLVQARWRLRTREFSVPRLHAPAQ